MIQRTVSTPLPSERGEGLSIYSYVSVNGKCKFCDWESEESGQYKSGVENASLEIQAINSAINSTLRQAAIDQVQFILMKTHASEHPNCTGTISFTVTT